MSEMALTKKVFRKCPCCVERIIIYVDYRFAVEKVEVKGGEG